MIRASRPAPSTALFAALLAFAGRVPSAQAEPPAPEATAAPAPPASAEAEPAPEPIDARAEYQRGNVAFQKGRFTTARYHYRRGLAADPAFDLLCNLGRAEAELRDDVAALEHLIRCVDSYPEGADLAESRARFATLRDEVRARLDVATVLRAEDAARRASSAPVGAGDARPPEDATSPLEPAEAPPPQGQDEGASPARLPVALSVGGLGLVGLGIGVGFAVAAGAAGGDADALQAELEADGLDCSPAGDPRCAELESALSRSDDAHNAAVVSLVAGGSLVVAGVLTYLLWPKAEQSAGRTELTPVFGFDPARGGLALGIRGRF